MPNIIEITDFEAPELDVFARLTEGQLRSRREPEKGIFIAESYKVIAHALDAGYEPVSFLMPVYQARLAGQGGLQSWCWAWSLTMQPLVIHRIAGRLWDGRFRPYWTSGLRR